MFDQILDLVKSQMNNNPQASAAVPADQQDAVSHEVASHISEGLKSHASNEGGVGGLLSMLGGGGSQITNAIGGGLISSLGSKFGLPPMATGAIAAALPGILAKFAQKANDPNDDSITPDSIQGSLGGLGGGLGGMLGGLFK
ncbi:MAG: hypothetical protein EOP42_20720 [Sphingobacteriaceae bacterium]|nr:MAG: hypothetical protein EOP42_20720 [Sphingobacteriaceae bacterium]